MSEIYISEFSAVARIAFSMWNREPGSSSYGSFDRQYWGWKYKDFSDATLQYAVKLAVEYAIRAGKSSTLPPLLEGYVAYLGRIQLKDGSFDQCYPLERTPGVVYDVLSTLIYVRKSPYLVNGKCKAELDSIIEKAAGFVLRTDEKHGEVANHIAEFSYELFFYANFSGANRAKRRAEEYLERLLTLFNKNEGWFHEYHGPDAGYQTRTLRYLYKIANLLENIDLMTAVKEAARFIEALLMPDGSVHPMLGVRSTAIVYPSAFEALAVNDTTFASLAARIREGWREGRVPLPSWLDFGNAIRLADDAMDAAEICAGETKKELEESFDRVSVERTDLSNAGISVIREPKREVYIAHKLGGAVVVYGKSENEKWSLKYEDSGYLLKTGNDGDTKWVSRMPAGGELVESSENSFTIQSRFYKSLHDEMTTFRLIVLRILNLTLLRSQWIGDLFRKIVVRRLMGGRKTIAVTLSRVVELSSDKVVVRDTITDNRPTKDNPKRGSLFRCRRIIGTHMASSRYFQEQELEETPLDWIKPVVWGDGNEASSVMEIKVDEK